VVSNTVEKEMQQQRQHTTEKGDQKQRQGVEHGHGGDDAPHRYHACYLGHTHILYNEHKFKPSKHKKDGFYDF
jgi:hypothetical protein